MPAVSVVMAVRNGARYVGAALDSLARQTLEHFECIVVDDGSTDETAEIVRTSKDRRVRLLSRAPRGLAASLNDGIEEARAEWVARMDADDLAASTRLEEQLDWCRASSDTVALGSDAWLIDAEGHHLWHARFSTDHGALVQDLLDARGAFPHSSVMLRRAAWADAGGYDPRFVRSQDTDLWLRLARRGRLASLNRPLLELRKHGDSLTTAPGPLSQFVFGLAAIARHRAWEALGRDVTDEWDETRWRGFLEALSALHARHGHARATSARETLRVEAMRATGWRRPVRVGLALVAKPSLWRAFAEERERRAAVAAAAELMLEWCRVGGSVSRGQGAVDRPETTVGR